MSQSILITGASSGIGLHLAKRIAEDKKFKVFAGVRKADDQKMIEALKIRNLLPILIDVQKPETITKCVELLKNENLSALINNAGIAIASPLELLPIEDFQDQFDVNVTGLLRVTQACLPLLRETRGRIINIGSISGKVTTPLVGAYSASKHAVEAMSDAFRRELRSAGIRVSLIEPGMIRTPIWDKSKDRAFELIAKIPKHAQDIYRPMVNKLVKKLELNLKNAAETEDVYMAVKHALESPAPKTRYLVGRDAKIGNIVRHLPDTWLDRLMATMGSVK